MAADPVLLPTAAKSEQFGGVRYSIEGRLAPVLTIELDATPIYFEHYILFWKDAAVKIGPRPLKAPIRRTLGGVPILLVQADGPGRIAFSRDTAGQAFPLHLKPGETVEVREHQFLAATDSMAYTAMRVKGVADLLRGGTGFFIDRFTCGDAEGALFLHGHGNVFELTLAEGEQIDAEPGAWVYKDTTVKMEAQVQRFSTALFASAMQLTWTRFTGPGRLALQSVSVPLQTEG